MIHVDRDECPDILVEKATLWQNSLDSSTTSVERKRAVQKYAHTEVRNALEKMFHNKCAYCESKIKHNSSTRIDHFRPKSRFPNLTFEWSNLLLSCEKCNSAACKGDKFPETDHEEPILNPCDDEPGDHLNFRYDSDTKLASVYSSTARGELTIKLLGLNRTDLRLARSNHVKKLLVIAEFSRQGNQDAKLLFAAALADQEEYLAFVRGLHTPHEEQPPPLPNQA